MQKSVLSPRSDGVATRLMVLNEEAFLRNKAGTASSTSGQENSPPAPHTISGSRMGDPTENDRRPESSILCSLGRGMHNPLKSVCSGGTGSIRQLGCVASIREQVQNHRVKTTRAITSSANHVCAPQKGTNMLHRIIWHPFLVLLELSSEQCLKEHLVGHVVPLDKVVAAGGLEGHKRSRCVGHGLHLRPTGKGKNHTT